MIRNIPNKYTQPMLLESINETHFGKFDFLYLRMDFKNKCNVGYAFINFINTEVVASFLQQHIGKKWGRFNSDKICSLSYATIQGRRALVDKFRNSSVMDEEPSYRPKIFYTSGPHLGQEEPFPGPTVSKDSSRGHGAVRRRISTAPHSDA
ncbi:MAG: RNA recognition motif 2-domain-containing protein [Linnemannia gamsii]|nr:MAG: RNA recognition motif 2-domain-containing protein [Linnemannia gamsii]